MALTGPRGRRSEARVSIVACILTADGNGGSPG